VTPPDKPQIVTASQQSVSFLSSHSSDQRSSGRRALDGEAAVEDAAVAGRREVSAVVRALRSVGVRCEGRARAVFFLNPISSVGNCRADER
jgi:hypothetical protein